MKNSLKIDSVKTKRKQKNMIMPYFNRELSWLEFNQRVLTEALREDLELLERLKFLAITASNLDEFFQVRIGSLILSLNSGINSKDESGMTTLQIYKAVRVRALKMIQDQYAVLNEQLIPAMKCQGLHILQSHELSEIEKSIAGNIYDSEIFPLLTPIALDDDFDATALPAMKPIIMVQLLDEKQVMRYVVITVPDYLNRFFSLSEQDGVEKWMLVEQLIIMHMSQLFPNEMLGDYGVFRLTRNGDIAVEDDMAWDLADEMQDLLCERKVSGTVRVELEEESSEAIALRVATLAGIECKDIVRIKGFVGMSSWMEIATLKNYSHLQVESWVPQHSSAVNPGVSMFETLQRQDVLLFHPYESFDPVIQLLEEAARDPQVIAIKQVLYRTAKQSKIMDALILAAENGKQVTVLVELKARFDEARNLNRAEALQRAGAQIVYGVKGLKTHAKICLIIRKEQGKIKRYMHLGTGNYNETTSRLYTDLSFLTSRQDYGNDASLFFNTVTGRSKMMRFQRLVPAPMAMKLKLLELIEGEAQRAKEGQEAKIMAKVNSLQDPDVIAALYRASQAGVKISLNVRGICCLKPKDEIFSKNIRVLSIIDRFLEHARLFYFHQGGSPELYIASADWMVRNLEKRIELMVPITNSKLQHRLIKILEQTFQDNIQAFEMQGDGSFQRLSPPKGAKKFRSQEQFYLEAKRSAKASEHLRSMTFEPHVPH